MSKAAHVPTTPASELARIREEHERERLWWEGVPPVSTLAELERLVATGQAVRIGNIGAGFRISATCHPDFRVLRWDACLMLEHVVNCWRGQMRLAGLASADEYFLVITSLGRTVEYQQELARAGYPTPIEAEDSTHTRLAAFDIGTTWFRDHEPRALFALMAVFEDPALAARVNVIVEEEVGALHIAARPLSMG